MVRHSIEEYERDQAHTNGIEGFWSQLKRAYHETYSHWSTKHTHRYLDEFTGRQNIRGDDTIDQMAHVAKGMQGKRLRYRELIA